jgi:aspartyl-tRNA(Asn)/glutamyl-tRNA(Gln) amidotransferase subunit A
MLGEMAGFDPKDSTSANIPVPNYMESLNGNIKGLRIGIPSEYKLDSMPDEIENVWQQGRAWLIDAGAEVVDISLPHTKYALPSYYIIAPAEASSNLARYDGIRYGLRVEGEDLIDTYEKTRAAGFGDEVKRRIMIGTYVLSAGYYDAYYLQAQKVRTQITNDFNSVWKECDAILTPTTPSAAFAIGDKMEDPIAMYLNDIFTVPASMAGLPAISIPAAINKEGLPLGLHVVGPAFTEQTVLRIADVIETAAEFNVKPDVNNIISG